MKEFIVTLTPRDWMVLAVIFTGIAAITVGTLYNLVMWIKNFWNREKEK